MNLLGGYLHSGLQLPRLSNIKGNFISTYCTDFFSLVELGLEKFESSHAS